LQLARLHCRSWLDADRKPDVCPICSLSLASVIKLDGGGVHACEGLRRPDRRVQQVLRAIVSNTDETHIVSLWGCIKDDKDILREGKNSQEVRLRLKRRYCAELGATWRAGCRALLASDANGYPATLCAHSW
tara:strand:+ start:324 stop:719 length:396 start_codon:yes stop_codon:yes gene_type:complete